MPTLNLGVLNVSYSSAHTGNPDAPAAQTTTAEVAEKLEERYHIMQTFYESRKAKIAEWLAEDMAHSLNALIQNGSGIKSSGKSTTYQKQYGQDRRKLTSEGPSLTYGADQKIEAEFRTFLDANEMNTLSLARGDGPISAAAARGVNHRKKRPYAKKNKDRPAFVDTGLYRASFRAWTK